MAGAAPGNTGAVELGDAGPEEVGIWLPLELTRTEVEPWLVGALPPLPPLPGGAVVVTIVVVVGARLLMPPLEMPSLPLLVLVVPVPVDPVVEAWVPVDSPPVEIPWLPPVDETTPVDTVVVMLVNLPVLEVVEGGTDVSETDVLVTVLEVDTMLVVVVEDSDTEVVPVALVPVVVVPVVETPTGAVGVVTDTLVEVAVVVLLVSVLQ